MLRARFRSSKSFISLCSKINYQCGCYIGTIPGRAARKETLYDELGVSMEASEQEIKKAYLELCKKYHPDSDVEDKSLHDKFLKINAAYGVLCKPSERKLYDQALRAGFNPAPDEVNTTENWNPNHAQYYYHPRFYKDPKMREAAAKAWEADSGWSFAEYYEDSNPHKVTTKDRIRGLLFTGVLVTIGCLLGLRIYYNAMELVAAQRRESAEISRRFSEEMEKKNVRNAKGKGKKDEELIQDNAGTTESDFKFLYHTEK